MPAPDQTEADHWITLGNALHPMVLDLTPARPAAPVPPSPLAPRPGELLARSMPGEVPSQAIDAAARQAVLLGVVLERWQVRALLIASAGASATTSIPR